MKNWKENWKIKTASAVLTLSFLVPTAAFADVDANTNGERPNPKGFAQHQPFKGKNQQELKSQLLELVNKYQPESLEEWEKALTEQDALREQMKELRPADKQKPELSDEIKEKVKAIHESLKNGEITPEQAQEQLKALGVENKGFRPGPELSDEVKEKVKAIHEELKNGEITPEEAQEQLKALGVEKKGFRPGPELSDEVKEKVKAIHEDVKNGEITPEQAKEEMENLGLQPRPQGQPDNLMAQIKKAVEDNDQTEIKELLTKMLEQLQEKNEDLSNRIAEAVESD